MVENGGVRLSALCGASPDFAEFMWRTPFIKPGPLSAVGRALRTKQTAQIDDLAAGRGYVERDHLITATVDIGGGRTLVAVPMIKEDEVVGAITIYRQEVQPFTPKQIELVENFAARPLSPSRTRGCSMNCGNLYSNKRPLQMEPQVIKSLKHRPTTRAANTC